jgi:hypothetical protein
MRDLGKSSLQDREECLGSLVCDGIRWQFYAEDVAQLVGDDENGSPGDVAHNH